MSDSTFECTAMSTRYECTAMSTRYECTAMSTRYECTAMSTRYECTAMSTRYECTAMSTRYECTAMSTRYECTAMSTIYACKNSSASKRYLVVLSQIVLKLSKCRILKRLSVVDKYRSDHYVFLEAIIVTMATSGRSRKSSFCVVFLGGEAINDAKCNRYLMEC